MSAASTDSQAVDRLARGMDVSARGIDLISTTAQLLNSPNGAIQIASNFVYWLGRERIGKDELEYCLVRARSLVHPNLAGMGFCTEVIKDLALNHVRGALWSIKSGCLGRTLLKDHGLSWITTTITSLYQFHDEKFITYAVTMLIVRMCEEREGTTRASKTNPWTDPTCLQIMPVISKISSSVWLNIVNTQYSTLPLPEELRSVCPIGHHLDSDDIVEAIARLKSPRRSQHVIIQSRFILFNLSLWLLYHFDGMFRVVVNNKIIYEKAQGAEKQEIELRVDHRCRGDGTCENARQSNDFKMIDHIADHWEDFFMGTSTSSSSCGSHPRARRKLYELKPFQAAQALDSRIRAVAADLTRWLCSLRVSISRSTVGIVYDVDLKRQGAPDHSRVMVADLLKRSPSILQASWASKVGDRWTPESAQDIWSPKGFAEAADSLRSGPNLFENTDITQTARSSLIQKCYPSLADLVQTAAQQCSCVRCQQSRDAANLQSGCLKMYAYSAVLRFVGHSIADAFGADDLSGAEETSQLESTLDVYAVERILLDVATKLRIVWQKWFEVAASVFLGRHYHNLGVRRHANGVLPADNSMTLAMQYGDLAVVAPWVDISKPISHIGLFGFIPVQGRLCISTTHRGHQFLDTEFAVVLTRPSETITQTMDESPVALTGPRLNVDHSHVEMDTMLFPSDQERHVLLNRVRVGQSSRVINPCAAVIMQLRQSHMSDAVACDHDGAKEAPDQIPNDIQQSLAVYNVENLLGTWPPSDLSRINVTQVFDSYLKYHIALALAQDGIVAVNRTSCWVCAAKELHSLKGKRIRSSSGRFLINTSKVMSEGYGSSGDGSLVTR